MKLKIYTVAGESSTHEHGGSTKYQSIVRQGSYGTGEFPPCFPLPELAQAWLDKNKQFSTDKVVELELEIPEEILK